jgi:hypothetical protein
VAARCGYFLSSEERTPQELVRQARLADQAGFDEVYVSQDGPETDGFFEFSATEVLPELRKG